MKQHKYQLETEWTGNTGMGTADYGSYLRDFTIHLSGKEPLLASSDPAFRGDAAKINPEEMLLSALSSCHMLWFLHECADHGIKVLAYKDRAEGLMQEVPGKGGYFIEVLLRPQVIIEQASGLSMCDAMHQAAGEKCFIANSCNFPVKIAGEQSSI